jgi:hypothetical protein
MKLDYEVYGIDKNKIDEELKKELIEILVSKKDDVIEAVLDRTTKSFSDYQEGKNHLTNKINNILEKI